MSCCFVAVYHGDSPKSARLICVDDDPSLVGMVVDRLLDQWPDEAEVDPVARALNEGRRAALEAVRDSQVAGAASARPVPADKPLAGNPHPFLLHSIRGGRGGAR